MLTKKQAEDLIEQMIERYPWQSYFCDYNRKCFVVIYSNGNSYISDTVSLYTSEALKNAVMALLDHLESLTDLSTQVMEGSDTE